MFLGYFRGQIFTKKLRRGRFSKYTPFHTTQTSPSPLGVVAYKFNCMCELCLLVCGIVKFVQSNQDCQLKHQRRSEYFPYNLMWICN